jgi:hypothetical protein
VVSTSITSSCSCGSESERKGRERGSGAIAVKIQDGGKGTWLGTGYEKESDLVVYQHMFMTLAHKKSEDSAVCETLSQYESTRYLSKMPTFHISPSHR